ncbi:MAG: peptidoglycan-binding domain-containing protein [Roseiarcus sp.]|uniref:peptidoglycan-binding domain-containing protein n=1 Tax=Roseiarcus sp. TaxID=1969460 RepID=UPI003C186D5C
MTTHRFWAAGLVALTAAAAAPALAAPLSPPAAATAAADAKLEAQKAAFLAMPEADRKAVQDALGWLDFYNGTVDGAFGKRSRDSILAYQQSVGAVQDGIVGPAELEALKTAAQRARAAVDFALVDDRISGVRIGAPLKLLTRLKPSSADTTLQSGDGGVSLALQARAGAGDDAGLAALYAQRSAEAGGRKISYKAIKAAEFFVVAGEDKGEKFYTRFAKSPADWPEGPILRGFAFAYPSERSSDFDKLALAVANSFDPFVDTPASHGAARMQVVSARSALDIVRVATGAPAIGSPVIGLSPGSRPTPIPPSGQTPAPAATAPAELRATALFVAPGQALTALPVVACADLAVDGKPAKILRADAPSGLTLIGGDFGAGAAAPTLAAGATDLVALSLSPAAGGKSTLEASPGAAAPVGEGTFAIVAALTKSASGAPAFDRRGALAGVVATIKDEPRRVGAVAIAEPHRLIGAEAIAAFLGLPLAAAPPQAASLSVGEIAAGERGALAEVVCRP